MTEWIEISKLTLSDINPREIKKPAFERLKKSINNVYTAAPNKSRQEYAAYNGAVFPTHLPTHFIKTFTMENAIVVDPFSGTGTTLIACEQTGRTCYAMEIDPKYCDVIIKRYASLTGQNEEEIFLSGEGAKSLHESNVKT